MINKINQEIKEQILILDNNGNQVTGLVDGNFTKSLLRNGGATGETLTVAEKGAGIYYISFTPTSTGYYEWKVIHSTYEPNGWYEYYTIVTYDTDSLYSQATTNTTSIESNSDANRVLVIANDDTNMATINTNTDTEIAAIDTKLDTNQAVLIGSFASTETLLKRILGLNQENFYIDNTTFNAGGALLTARMRIYTGSEYVGTGSGVLATYDTVSAYDGNGYLDTFKVTKQ